jgi:hypothetical protein
VKSFSHFIFSDIGMGVGAFAMGWVASEKEFPFMYFVEAAMVMAVLLLYMLLHGRKVQGWKLI